MGIPALHSLVPAFSLPDQHAHPVSLLDYKHQQALVLVFCETDCPALLQGFTERYLHYREADAEILAVTPNLLSLDLPFPILFDADRSVTTRLTAQSPEILVIDSYGELYARMEGPWIDGPDHQQILGWLTMIQMQCPECGAPEWPYPEQGTSD